MNIRESILVDLESSVGGVRNELFSTPLKGSYNWNYVVEDSRIMQLYRSGKENNWNVDFDIDWNKEIIKDNKEVRIDLSGFGSYAPFLDLSEVDKDQFLDHLDIWTISQFLHGEQGALIVSSQLVSSVPTIDAKLYASSQVFDEARHVEIFSRLLKSKYGSLFPVSGSLREILDSIIEDDRWDLKFIGMQIIIEGLALSAFHAMRDYSDENSIIRDCMSYVINDEARHVAFGVHFLKDFVSNLSKDEIEERAEFAYRACALSRERLVPTEVFEHWGWDLEECRSVSLAGPVNQAFRKLLFQRVIPNLRKIGLLTDIVRPKFEALGLLEFEYFEDF